MRITDLEVDEFGIWKDLRLTDLSEQIHVFYGPNEAGKTTLLEFVRAVFYGFPDKLRTRYLSAVLTRPAGGSIGITGAHGRFSVSRHVDREHHLPGGQLSITGADGAMHAEQSLSKLLSNIDEATFNNVFALGLDELQELGTLRDTDAAQYLFRLTVGLDRVSLADVERELATSRLRILGSAEQPGQIGQLRAERNRLTADLHELGEVNRHYARTTRQRETVNQEIGQLEGDTNTLQQRIRVIEIASSLREKWTERAGVDTELTALGNLPPIPSGSIQRLERCNARITSRRQSLAELKQKQQELKVEAAKLPRNEALTRQTARIEVLSEQHDWLAAIEKETQTLSSEVQELDAKLQAEFQRLGLPLDAARAAVANIQQRTLAPLGPVARGIRSARQRREEAEREVLEQRETAEVLEKQLRGSLNQRSLGDLGKGMEETGSLVSVLRRRVQVEDRLAQMTRHEAELEEQSQRLLDRQLLPVQALVAIGSPFVLGVVLTLIGLFLPESITGSFGWLMAALGLIGTSVAVGLKIAMERTASRQLETCRKQLEMLALQISQAREEREKLDAQIPRGGGPLITRLQTAEGDLAGLEELLPLDAQRHVALQAAKDAASRAERASGDYNAARKRWRQALSSAGLPETWSPTQVQQFRERAEQIGEVRRRLERSRHELSERQRTLQGLSQRIADLCHEVGLNGKSSLASQQLQQLRRAMQENQQIESRRDGLLQQSAECTSGQRQQRSSLVRWKRRRAGLLRAAGAATEQEFRRRAQLQSRIALLRQRREALVQEIATTCGPWCSEEALAQLFETTTPAALDERWEELTGRLNTIERQLHQLFEQRGTLNQELKTLLADRRLERTQLELNQVEQRLREALERWQVLAVTSTILAEIRRLYEAERQPETLQEASVYLERLTEGKYRRVWSPLGESVLKVDDSEGQTLPIEVLSRGAREQLFLGLRLALVSMFRRRGATLPLVLDDILVNFDTRRARAAAVVLRDFAAEGHQLLVFTCHEHILKLFRSIKATVERLPERSGNTPTIVQVEPVPLSVPAEEPEPEVEPEPIAPPPRRANPAAKRKKRSEVVVNARNDFDESLMASATRSIGLRRIDPPEETPPEPPMARMLTREDFEDSEFDFDPHQMAADVDAAFGTDVDEFEVPPIEIVDMEDDNDAA